MKVKEIVSEGGLRKRVLKDEGPYKRKGSGVLVTDQRRTSRISVKESFRTGGTVQSRQIMCEIINAHEEDPRE